MEYNINFTFVTLVLMILWLCERSVVNAHGWSQWSECRSHYHHHHHHHRRQSDNCGEGIQWRYLYDCHENNYHCRQSQTCHIHCSGETAYVSTRVDGGWSTWSAYSSCSTSCGTGVMRRTRTCTHPPPQNGGHHCYGDAEMTHHCRSHCPIDGGWSSWTQFSDCSAKCGGGIRTRSRSCTHPAPAHGGLTCPGDSHESEHCNSQSCPINGGWSHWSRFHKCSVSCGGGTKMRVRTCTHPKPAHGGQDCVGDSHETTYCNSHECPVDGSWSNWTPFSPCSASCGGGTQHRTRSCDNPKPSHDGRGCRGYSHESLHCNDQNCPVNGGWSNWSSFSQCSVSCGGGNKARSRSCNNPTPTDIQHTCHGDPVQYVHCNHHACPVDGGWSSWSHFSPCSVSCGDGTMSRERFCNNPWPDHHGSYCSGDSQQTQHCHDRECPINGEWSQWSAFSHCSVTCGYGNKTRSRSCTNPSPAYGGHVCYGDFTQTINCMDIHCPVNGEWGGWSQWGAACSVTCGQGVRTRDRHCSNPPPSHGGAACVGVIMETQTCQQPDCPVNGEWSNWSQWNACSVTCGQGFRIRDRHCSNPPPSHGGAACVGVDLETQTCQQSDCPVNGQWSVWGQFSLCSTTCGPGAQTRKRTCSHPAPSNGGLSCVGRDTESFGCEIKPCLATTTQQWITLTTTHAGYWVTIRKK